MAMRWLFGILILSALADCRGKDEEEEPLTPETFQASCLKLLQTSCERFTDCLAPLRTDPGKTRDDYIRECIADNMRTEGACAERFARAECPAEEKAATDRCEPRVRAAECSALCGGSSFVFCWSPCLYVCPAKK